MCESQPPLQALLFAPMHWHDILAGYKVSTIRDGTRNYKVGKTVMLCCHIANMCLLATVTRVTQCTLEEIPKVWLCDHDYPWQKYLLEAYMKRFYPDMTLQSPITIVEWGNVKGSAIGR